jgi:hypothetical protein
MVISVQMRRKRIYHPLFIILHSPVIRNSLTSAAETTSMIENYNVIDIIIALERFDFWSNYVPL